MSYLVLCVCSALAQPQGPDTLWTRVYEMPDLATLLIGDIALLDDGGFLVSGQFCHNDFDGGLYLMRFDSSGNLQWRHGIGDTSGSVIWTSSLCKAGPDRYLIVGHEWAGSDFGDPYFVMVDAAGNIIWERLFDLPAIQVLMQVCSTGDGGALMVCSRSDNAARTESIEWMKIDSAGDSLRTGSLTIPHYQIGASCVAQTSDGGYVIGGGGVRLEDDDKPALLVKLDSEGALAYYKMYRMYDECWAWGVCGTPDGGMGFCGNSQRYSDGYSPIVVLRTDEDGDSLWSWSSGQWGTSERILPTGDGGVTICGNTGDAPSLVHFGPAIDEVWVREYPVNDPYDRFGVAQSLIQTAQGSYVMVGECGLSGDPPFPMVAVTKTLPDVNASGKPRPSIDPAPDLRLSAGPNPFNGASVISFSVARAGEVKIDLYDITGRLVRVVQEGRMEAGEHRVSLNAEGMSSGIYFVRMEAGNQSKTAKLVVLR